MDLVRNVEDASTAAKNLVDHALNRFSTDNLSCMVVRFDKAALLESQNDKDNAIGVELATRSGKSSEADKIVRDTKQKILDGDVPAVGVSASNSGRGQDPGSAPDDFKPTTLDGTVEEEPGPIDAAGPEETSPEVSTSAENAPNAANTAKEESKGST